MANPPEPDAKPLAVKAAPDALSPAPRGAEAVFGYRPRPFRTPTPNSRRATRAQEARPFPFFLQAFKARASRCALDAVALQPETEILVL